MEVEFSEFGEVPMEVDRRVWRKVRRRIGDPTKEGLSRGGGSSSPPLSGQPCRDLHAKHRRNVITWSDVRTATAADPNIQSILQLLVTGFPYDSRTLPPQIRLYHPFSSSLYELDGVLSLT